MKKQDDKRSSCHTHITSNCKKGSTETRPSVIVRDQGWIQTRRRTITGEDNGSTELGRGQLLEISIDTRPRCLPKIKVQ